MLTFPWRGRFLPYLTEPDTVFAANGKIIVNQEKMCESIRNNDLASIHIAGVVACSIKVFAKTEILDHFAILPPT